MQADFIYENAPLIEVIAEIHWRLEPLQAIPNAAVDPYFRILRDGFARHFQHAGFDFQEKIVPDEMPLELLAHRPVLRFRRGHDQWPLFQLGPGVLTANIVPPYEGWLAFKPYIREAVQALYDVYPDPETFLRLERVELRYIDGFTQGHGFSTFGDFVKEHLALNLELPRRLVDRSLADGQEVSASSEFRIPMKHPKGSTGFIKVMPGTVRGETSAILEFILRSDAVESSPQTRDDLLGWFDAAHTVVKSWFKQITKKSLQEIMGPTRSIKRVKL